MVYFRLIAWRRRFHDSIFHGYGQNTIENPQGQYLNGEHVRIDARCGTAGAYPSLSSRPL